MITILLIYLYLIFFLRTENAYPISGKSARDRVIGIHTNEVMNMKGTRGQIISCQQELQKEITAQVNTLETNHWSEVKEYGTISNYLYHKNKINKPGETKRKKKIKQHSVFYCYGITWGSQIKVLNLLINLFKIRVKRRP